MDCFIYFIIQTFIIFKEIALAVNSTKQLFCGFIVWLV